jgi:hypothetical protein
MTLALTPAGGTRVEGEGRGEKRSSGCGANAVPRNEAMARIYRLILSDHDHEDADRQTASLAGMAVTLLIVVVCLFLIRELHNKAAIEDCLLAGHHNCDAIVAKLYGTSFPR